MRHGKRILGILGIWLASALIGPALAQDLTVDGYSLVSKSRVSRTEFEYTYRANISNTGLEVENVAAALSSTSPHTAVIDRDLSFGAVSSDATVTSSDTFTIRHNRLYPFSWANFSWEISFDSVADDTRTVGPQGGTFEFPSGVVLEIPAGALPNATEITVSSIDCGAIDPILDARTLASHEKDCLAGFSAEPSGLEFQAPIVARFPVPPLESGVIPILTKVDRVVDTYHIIPTDLVYDAATGLVQIQVSSFSDTVVTSLQLTPDEEFGPEWAEAGEEIDLKCGSCAGQLQDGGANLPFCENLDPYQNSCCEIPPAEREQCYSACFCCKEQSKVVASSVDFSSGDCQLLGDEVEITYHACPGSPTFKHAITETSAACPPDLEWEISVVPSTLPLFACEASQLQASILGRSPDGSIVVPLTFDFPLRWRSLNPAVGDFIDNAGTLKALKAGSAVVEARISDDPAVTPGQGLVSVESNIAAFTLDHAQLSLQVDEVRLVQSQVLAAPGRPPAGWPALDPNAVDWSSADPGIANYTPAGFQASVSGVSRGATSIIADFNYLCESKHAVADVTVECQPVTFTVDPPTLDLLVDQSHLLAATAFDENRDLLDATGVTWSSGDESVVDLINLVGPQTAVQGLRPSSTPIPVTATYDDGCQIKEESALVTVGCADLELSVTEGIVTVDAFLPIAVSAVDRNGNPIEIDETQITWSSSNPDIAAVIPSVGALVTVIGISPGPATITASFDEGTCGIRLATASIQVREAIIDMTGDWHWEFADLTLFGGCPEPWWPSLYLDQGVRGPRIVTFTQTGNILTVDDPELNATWSGAITDTGGISLTSTYPEPQMCNAMCAQLDCLLVTRCETNWTVTGSVSGDTFTLDASYAGNINSLLFFLDEREFIDSVVCLGTDRVTGVRQ